MEIGAPAMKPGAHVGGPRHCLECGKLIARRRVTAVYCSGKCREIHNAKKRRQAREDAKNGSLSAPDPETDK